MAGFRIWRYSQFVSSASTGAEGQLLSSPGDPRGSFASTVRTWAHRQPEAPAVTVVSGEDVEATLTYRQLDALSSGVASALIDVGVGVGSRVAHLGRNRAGYPPLLYGASKARATLVGLNWRLTAHELAPLLADARPEVVVVDPEFAATAAAAAEQAEIACVLLDADDITTWVTGSTDPGLVPEADDIALIFYTSGTTGVPKGAMLPVRSIAANLRRPMPWRMRPGVAALVCSPMFHTAGTGWTYLPGYLGAHCLVLRDPSPNDILGAISRHAVGQALLVPAVIQMVINDPTMASADLSHLESVVYGASPITKRLLSAAIDAFGCEFVQAYGMTETGGPIAYLRPEDHDPADPLGRLGSAGRPPEGIEVRITDPETGTPCDAGEFGEVWTRSDQQMVGYLNQPEATAQTLTPDGWLRTGDGGYTDTDGYVFLTDRLTDVIVTGGENVYPLEVENILAAHPSIAEVAVIGVPDDRWGETVHAVVVLAAGVDPADIEPATFIAWCRKRLAHYKAPTGVDVAPSLPRNPAGKVLRRVLRQPYWTDGEAETA